MHTMKAIDNIKQYTPAALWKRAKEHIPARAKAAPKAPASSWAGKAPIPSGRKWWLTALDIFLHGSFPLLPLQIRASRYTFPQMG